MSLSRVPCTRGSRYRQRRTLRRRAVIAAVIAMCLLVLGAGWVGTRGVRTRTHLTNAAALIRDLEIRLKNSDLPAARAALAAREGGQSQSLIAATWTVAW